MTDTNTITPTEIIPLQPEQAKELTEQDLPELGIRQTKMLNYIMQGYPNHKAYLMAGYECVDHAHKAAFQLVNRPPLSIHIEYYRKRNSRMITKEWKQEKLQQLIDMSLDKDNPMGIDGDIAIKAMAELNKMQGDYAPQAPIQVNNVHAALEDIRQARQEYLKDR